MSGPSPEIRTCPRIIELTVVLINWVHVESRVSDRFNRNPLDRVDNRLHVVARNGLPALAGNEHLL